jgi:leader peptidase (prepilin peptidase) / N-methyltransferase
MDAALAFPLGLAIASPFIGSFLGVLVLRLPEGRPVVAGRSACDACGHVLGPLDMVPLASFAALGGRCRHCQARIDPIHALVEIGALAIVLWAATVTAGWILVASCLFGWTLLALALADIRTGLLPDALTLPLLLTGLIAAYLLTPADILDHLIGAAAGFIAFALLATLYRLLRGRDGLGLGDAKLLGAMGAWVSWQGLPTIILYASIAGLGMALWLFWRQQLTATSRIAFGAPLALAGWLVWLYGPLVP